MESMIEAAVHVGFPRHVAQKLVIQTIKVNCTPPYHFVFDIILFWCFHIQIGLLIVCREVLLSLNNLKCQFQN